MKKLIYIVTAFLLGAVLVSCGNKLPVPDEFGFYTDMDSAKKIAQKNNKNILLYITMGGFDSQSDVFLEKVLHSEEYKKCFDSEYVSVHFDFGSKAYEKTDVSKAKTESEKKKIEQSNIQVAKNLSLARSLGVQGSPAVYLMNKDGYAFADEVYNNPEEGFDETDEEFSEEVSKEQLPNTEPFSSVAKLKECIDEYKEDFEVMQYMVDTTKKGTVLERMESIRTIYETVEDKYMPSMSDLFEQVPSIDKANESGLVSYLYYVYVVDQTEAYTMVNDYASAISFVQNVVNKGILEGEELQGAYFMLGNMMIQVGSSDYAAVAEYMTKSYEAAPDSEMAQILYGIITQLNSILESQENSAQTLPEGN